MGLSIVTVDPERSPLVTTYTRRNGDTKTREDNQLIRSVFAAADTQLRTAVLAFSAALREPDSVRPRFPRL
jgi:hypothetical protein